MALPTKLHVEIGTLFEGLGYNDETGVVTFKYKYSDGSTFPAWFKGDDAASGSANNKPYVAGSNTGGAWEFCDNSGTEASSATGFAGSTTHIKIKNAGNLANWSAWEPAMLNRAALLGVIQNGQFHEKSITSNYTIKHDYTYNTLRVDASGGAITITLPDPSEVLQRSIRVLVDDSSNTVTLARNGSEQIDGVAQDTTLTAGPNAVEITTNGANWFTQSSVGYSHSDSAPVQTIRTLTQAAYNALGTKDPNTLYIIEADL